MKLISSEVHFRHSLESRALNLSSTTSASSLDFQPNCVLWCFCDENKVKTIKKSSDLASTVGVSPNAEPLGDVFGLKIFTDSPIPGVDETVSTFLADFLVNSSRASPLTTKTSERISPPSSPTLPSIGVEDLKIYLAYASRVDVELTPEAKALITGYYIASRKRSASGNKSALPVSAVGTLTSLAVAHAKLRINDKVRNVIRKNKAN